MIKEIASKVFAALVHRKNQKWIQKKAKIFAKIGREARTTARPGICRFPLNKIKKIKTAND